MIKEFHDEENIYETARIIDGSKNYFLQQYEHSPKELSEKSFGFYTLEEMKIFKENI